MRSNYEESEAEVDRLFDENSKLRADIRAADEDYEEQECYISQVELKANGPQEIFSHLTATHLQEEMWLSGVKIPHPWVTSPLT